MKRYAMVGTGKINFMAGGTFIGAMKLVAGLQTHPALLRFTVKDCDFKFPVLNNPFFH